MTRTRIFVVTLFVASAVSCAKEESSMQDKVDDGIALVFKHNFRTAEKEGYRIEIWTSGRHGHPISPGFRVYESKKQGEKPPATVVRLVLTSKERPEDGRVVVVDPVLKPSIIEGGYRESIYVDEVKRIERKGVFLGEKGVWEIVMLDPYKFDPRKFPGPYPPPGDYTLSVQVSIKDGPIFQFDDLPYQFFKGRGDPGPQKKSK